MMQFFKFFLAVGSPVSVPDDDSNTYKYIAAGAAIVFFCLGWVFGAISHKKYHKRVCKNKHDINPGK